MQQTHEIDLRLQTSSNVSKVLSLRTMFKIIELLLGLSFSFVGGVGVADRTGKTKGTVSVYAQSDLQHCQTYALRPAATCVGSLESLSDFPWPPCSSSWSFFSASALASLEVLGLLIALKQRYHVSTCAYAPECNRGLPKHTP
jgi:hypothetical protein